MLITFKSAADADVIMFSEIAQRLLEILGKDPLAPQGIITAPQLPAALAALRAAIEQDRLAQPPEEEPDTWGMDEIDKQAVREAQRKRAQQVSLAQRAMPLLQMLEYAQRDQANVIWES